MPTNLCSNILVTSIVCFSLAVSQSVVTAQNCGDLPENLCGYVETAVSNWNNRIDTDAKITDWVQESTQRLSSHSLIDMLGGNDIRAANVDNEGRVHIVLLNEEEKNRWYNAELHHLNQWFSDNMATIHIVGFDWDTTEGKFNTKVAVNERNPYLYGRILSGIVVESDSNSCLYKRLIWLWGSTRGEIFANLTPQGDDRMCRQEFEAWMTFGSAKVKMDKVSHDSARCNSQYAWAYATPLVSISFERDGFSFTVNGLGSSGMGGGMCDVARSLSENRAATDAP